MQKNKYRLIAFTSWAIYMYMFMEWIFFVTKPSFMSSMNSAEKISVFLLSSFIVAVPILVITLIIASISVEAGTTIPAFILCLLSMILLDNFTYTLFKVGIVTSTGLWRAMYAAGFAMLFVMFVKKINSVLQRKSLTRINRTDYVLLFLAAASTIVFLFNIPQFNLAESNNLLAGPENLPNIILIGIDGVNATHMSLYGYLRDTTPNITRLSKQALVVENAYSNAGKTGGSLTSILTGKPSTETRVVFPPDILMGADAYQHLPGILKHLGYHTVQITMQYYGDAYERNIRDGFDIANGRSESKDPLLAQLAGMGGGGSVYFIGQVLSRITERLGHIFFIKQMDNPYAAVTQARYALHDDQRMKDMFRYIDETKGPLFLHIHLMDTHGPEFYVPHQVFSNSSEENNNWNLDYYDDTILNSDKYINDLFEHLEKTGKRQNTLVILYSDHGIQWTTLERVPLVFWFPEQKYAGSIQSNAELLDISPTILDYLKIPQPYWMSGHSILKNNLSPSRPIFSAIVSDELLRVTDDRTTWVVDETKIAPPFFQLGYINLVVCNQWFSLNLRNPSLQYGDITGSTTICDKQHIPSPEEAFGLIVQYLKGQKYDVTLLPANISIQAVP